MPSSSSSSSYPPSCTPPFSLLPQLRLQLLCGGAEGELLTFPELGRARVPNRDPGRARGVGQGTQAWQRGRGGREPARHDRDTRRVRGGGRRGAPCRASRAKVSRAALKGAVCLCPGDSGKIPELPAVGDGRSAGALVFGVGGGGEGCPGKATPKFQVLRQNACPAGTLDPRLPLALSSVGTLQKQKFPPWHKPDAQCLPYGKDKGQESR